MKAPTCKCGHANTDHDAQGCCRASLEVCSCSHNKAWHRSNRYACMMADCICGKYDPAFCACSSFRNTEDTNENS